MTTRHFYIYDGQHTLLEFAQDVAEPVLTHRYLHGPAVDQILADEQVLRTYWEGNVMWPLTDNQGTVRDVAHYDPANHDTSIVNHITYDAFGQITYEQQAAIDHIFGYTGRERDEESDLYFYRARYYDPTTGQFIGQDPIGFEAGDANLYRYVGNGPTNATDPSGLAPADEPQREVGHKKKGDYQKHSAAERARWLQHQNALRKYAQETKNADVIDALKHIDSAIDDCRAGHKTAERKMLKEGARMAEYADEMAELKESMERLKEIDLVVENSEIVDIKHLDDLPEPALEALTKPGRWIIGKKVLGVLPYLGVAAGVASYPEKVEANGYYCGTLQAGLEETPVIEWVMLAGGDRIIPSDEYVKGMFNVARHPAQTYEKLRKGKEVYDVVIPAAKDSWIDELFESIEAMLGRF